MLWYEKANRKPHLRFGFWFIEIVAPWLPCSTAEVELLSGNPWNNSLACLVLFCCACCCCCCCCCCGCCCTNGPCDDDGTPGGIWPRGTPVKLTRPPSELYPPGPTPALWLANGATCSCPITGIGNWGWKFCWLILLDSSIRMMAGSFGTRATLFTTRISLISLPRNKM